MIHIVRMSPHNDRIRKTCVLDSPKPNDNELRLMLPLLLSCCLLLPLLSHCASRYCHHSCVWCFVFPFGHQFTSCPLAGSLPVLCCWLFPHVVPTEFTSSLVHTRSSVADCFTCFPSHHYPSVCIYTAGFQSVIVGSLCSCPRPELPVGFPLDSSCLCVSGLIIDLPDHLPAAVVSPLVSIWVRSSVIDGSHLFLFCFCVIFVLLCSPTPFSLHGACSLPFYSQGHLKDIWPECQNKNMLFGP